MIKSLHSLWQNNPHFDYVRRLYHRAMQSGVYRRSARVAFVVGTLLNLINQPQAMLELVLLDFISMQPLSILKIALTYAVPFLVATYATLSSVKSGSGAPND